jgi:hypothetical protein
LIEQYFQSLTDLVASLPFVADPKITFEERGEMVGFIRGDIEFKDGTFLHFRELVDLRLPLTKVMYAYHYQKADGFIVFRYDNTAHHMQVPTFPDHKHASDGSLLPASPPNLESVMREIENLMTTK